jgi:hypothetical protein
MSRQLLDHRSSSPLVDLNYYLLQGFDLQPRLRGQRGLQGHHRHIWVDVLASFYASLVFESNAYGQRDQHQQKLYVAVLYKKMVKNGITKLYKKSIFKHDYLIFFKG